MKQAYLIEPIESSQPLVKGEVTFWRDMKLLQRHRDWGWNVPAEDIDFLEYDERKAIALIEYKRRVNLDKVLPDLNGANIQALINLGDRAAVPAFCVFYAPSRKWFRVFGLNSLGKRHQPRPEILSEYEYVDFLYWIRGRTIPKDIAKKLWY